MDLNDIVLQELGEMARWGIFTTDKDLTVTGWSRWMELRSGLSEERAVGRNLIELFPEMSERRTERYYRQALEGQMVVMSQRLHGYIVPLASTIPGAESTLMHQSGHIAALRNGSDVVGTLTLIEDVSERVVYESELRTRALQQAAVASFGRQGLSGSDPALLFQRIVQSVADVLQVDCCRILEFPAAREAVRIHAQAGAAEHFGGATIVDLEPLIEFLKTASKPVPRGWPVDDAPREASGDLLAGGFASGLEIPFEAGPHLRGSLGVYMRRPRTFTPDETQFLQALVNVLGMAVQRNALEQELRKHVEQLAEADRRKDEFLAMLAHELRNPLAPIRNAAVLLGVDNLDAETSAQAREIIGRQVEHMVRLVDDLLDVSRILRGRIELRPEPIELTNVVQRAIETSQPLIQAQEHQLTVEFPTEPIWLRGDTVRLAQSLSNLLNNSAKYTDRRGRITLSAEREGREVVIRVQDNGTGIDAEFLPRVFDVFIQADRSIARSQGGLGIGLTLVRSLIQMHGGTITAHSEGVGKGSTFSIRLPLIDPPRQIQAKDPQTAKTRPLRILVVDDNVGSGRMLQSLLSKFWGHEVRTANDGLGALQVAMQFRPELILLDIGLPGMNGYEVARQIRQLPELRSTLVVALTGYGQSDDFRKSREAGFDEHLVKPTSVDDLQRLFANENLT